MWYPLSKLDTSSNDSLNNVNIKHLKDEQMVNGWVKNGYHRMWYDNGNLYKSVQYFNNKKT